MADTHTVRNFSRRFVIVAVLSGLAAMLMVVAIVAVASARPRERAARESTPPSRAAARAASATATSAPTITTRPLTTRPLTTRPLTTRPPVSSATVPARTLAEGASGADVLALQSALLRHGYWLRDAPGTFGEATAHAVVSFEKATGFARDGIVDAAEFTKLRTAKRFKPRSVTGRVFEVDLQRQLLLDVDNGRVAWVFDTSTGRIPGTTPSGSFHVYQQVDGWVHGTLGTLYRPKFFAGNVGIHGSPSIPPYPASHGCVRMYNAAMDWIWASGDLTLGTAVWVY
jgi:hypothetical protein